MATTRTQPSTPQHQGGPSFDMDFTPPSLTQSPGSPELSYTASPPRKPDTYYSVDPVAASYPSPSLMDFPYKPSAPYSTMNSSPAIQSIELPMAQASWAHTSDTVHVTSPPNSAGLPQLMAGEYVTPFAPYDSCLPTTYSSNDSYGMAAVNMPHSPPLSTSAPARTPTPVTFHRSSFGYAQDPAAPRVKMEGPAHFSSPALEHASFSMPAYSDSSAFSHGQQRYMPDNSMATWPKQEMVASQLYSAPASPRTQASQEGRRPTGINKARRQPRKHTTREEANFQCQVKGCGKFFSRSYNFKSHMETHDDGREYPFPCSMQACNKKFVRKTDLQRHHQSVHMKERNHKCDYCSRLFARKDTLRR